MTEAEIKRARSLMSRVLYTAGVFAMGAATREELRRSEDELIKADAAWRKYRAQLSCKYDYYVVEKALGIKEDV